MAGLLPLGPTHLPCCRPEPRHKQVGGVVCYPNPLERLPNLRTSHMAVEWQGMRATEAKGECG